MIFGHETQGQLAKKGLYRLLATFCLAPQMGPVLDRS
jgi:hypothetical protein